MPPKVKTKAIRQPAEGDPKGKRTIIRRFPQFSRLPIELRLMIWVFAAWAPRLVKASWRSNFNVSVYKFMSGAVPGVLHVNLESRNTALKIFTQVPKFISFTGVEYKYKVDIMIYLNKLDTIYFLNRPPSFQFLGALRAIKRYFQLDHLAIPVEHLDIYHNTPPSNPILSSRFRLRKILKAQMSLKRFVVIIDRTKPTNLEFSTRYKLVPVTEGQGVPCKDRSCQVNKLKVEEYIDEVWNEEEPRIANSYSQILAREIREWEKYKAEHPEMLKPKVEMLRLVRK